jgi:glycosyltransferase 2 family protein
LIRLRTLLKWTLFAAVLAYVCRHGYRLWQQSDVRAPLTPASGFWLLLSSGLYTASWLPSVWFWRGLMRAMGGRPPFVDAARAYYCGSLGKYVPGKAMVLVIRGSLMRGRGSSGRAAAVTAAYETLTMMGTGLLVGLILAPLPAWVPGRDEPWLLPLIVLVVAAGLPGIARLLSWVVIKTTPADLATPGGQSPSVASQSDVSRVANDESPTQVKLSIPTWLVAAGCAAFVVSWAMQGLSLGLTLRAVGDPIDWHDWPIWSGGMALSTSLGFAVLFAPAGLGVREGILLGVLNEAGVSPHAAIAATVLSRLVAFFSDVVAAALLYPSARSRLVSPESPAGR